MRPTVTRDFVAFPGSPRENLGMLGYHLAEHKECDLDMMRSEYIEQFRRKRRARSIVKGHRDVGAVDVHRIKRDRWFLGRGWSLCRSFLLRLRRYGLGCRFDRMGGYSGRCCRRGLGCDRNAKT